MIVSINQPAYLPWLGYFDRIAASDLHVILDNVQFEKNSFINRNRIITARGPTWLTVPVQTSGRFGALTINELKIAEDQRWAAKHLQTLTQAYAKAPHFTEHAGFFTELYGRSWGALIDLIDPITDYMCRAFRVATPHRRASTLSARGRKDDLVLQICLEVGAKVYLSGPLGRNYLDVGKFHDRGIEVRFADYRHPVYPQRHDGFVPNMAAIDLLFMVGDQAGDVLRTTKPAPAGALTT